MNAIISSQSNEFDIEKWIADKLANALNCDPKQIEATVPIVRYGIDSAQVIEIAAAMSEQLNYDVEPGLFWDFEDIRSLSHYLAQELHG